MNKILKIGLIVVGVVILFSILNFFGMFSFLNNPINRFVAGEPTFNCVTDNDCKLTDLDCDPGCGISATNKNWKGTCPFNNINQVSCAMFEHTFRKPKCINNKCEVTYDTYYYTSNICVEYYTSNLTEFMHFEKDYINSRNQSIRNSLFYNITECQKYNNIIS